MYDLLFWLSGIACKKKRLVENVSPCNAVTLVEGGIIRGNRNIKKLSLVFTGHEFADGAETIMTVLKRHDIKGTFFLTGEFYWLYP